MTKEKGFSLIELAIVLVIAGLLLAGVMRGQELIANAKVKSLANDFRNIPTYFYGYQDRFRALPGDDHAASTHLTGAASASTNNHVQNGLIQGDWNSTTNTDESFLVWQHLRLAGLATGTSDIANAQYAPLNSEGGKIGLTSTASLTAVNANTFNTAHAMCSDSILGRYAQQLDTLLDDGVGNTGSMRILVNGVQSAGEAAPATGTAYLVCMSF